MYLIDTNVWLERLLDQELSKEIGVFFKEVSASELFITEFALYSIGILLTHEKRINDLLLFLKEAIDEPEVGVIRLNIADYRMVTKVVDEYNLDFDDAYQYTAAEKFDLTIISLDTDFDRTERGRKTPGQVLAGLEG